MSLFHIFRLPMGFFIYYLNLIFIVSSHHSQLINLHLYISPLNPHSISYDPFQSLSLLLTVPKIVNIEVEKKKATLRYILVINSFLLSKFDLGSHQGCNLYNSSCVSIMFTNQNHYSLQITNTLACYNNGAHI